MSRHDKYRIFTNLYGFQPWNLKSAQARGDWDDTKTLMKRGQDAIIEEIKASGLREIGRASCGGRVCQYVKISVVAGSLEIYKINNHVQCSQYTIASTSNKRNTTQT